MKEELHFMCFNIKFNTSYPSKKSTNRTGLILYSVKHRTIHSSIKFLNTSIILVSSIIEIGATQS
jgi:hypothetical protein